MTRLVRLPARGRMLLILGLLGTFFIGRPSQASADTPGVFTIPAGYTATLSDAVLYACDPLEYGYQLDGATNVPVGSKPYGCYATTIPSVTVPVSPTSRVLRVYLLDTYGGCSDTYYSDGNHARVSGSNPWTVDIVDSYFCFYGANPRAWVGDGNLHVTLTIAPPPEQAVSAQGMSFIAQEGASVTATVATFSDPSSTSTANEYAATIAWGDGSSSTGTVTGSGGTFSVSGTHTYAEEGSYTVTTTIHDTDTPSNDAATTSQATVADAALAESGACSPTSLQAYGGPTANFADASSTGTLSDFSATIDWGDGFTSDGTVTGGPGRAAYTVSGAHAYALTGPFTITTTIKDAGGSTATMTCQTLVSAFAPGGGSFVIGDVHAGVDNSVYFWGAQWVMQNSVSGGGAPDSFKGFAESPKIPSCGINWSTDPGNSTPPPPGPLPAYMAVVVTSHSGGSRSSSSGDTVHIVVVKTNPGYEPDPGHPGTGQVVAQVC